MNLLIAKIKKYFIKNNIIYNTRKGKNGQIKMRLYKNLMKLLNFLMKRKIKIQQQQVEVIIIIEQVKYLLKKKKL